MIAPLANGDKNNGDISSIASQGLQMSATAKTSLFRQEAGQEPNMQHWIPNG